MNPAKSDYQQVIDAYCDKLREMKLEFGEHSIDHICQILRASVNNEHPEQTSYTDDETNPTDTAAYIRLEVIESIRNGSAEGALVLAKAAMYISISDAIDRGQDVVINIQGETQNQEIKPKAFHMKNWDRPIDRYLVGIMPGSELISIDEYDTFWKAVHKLNGSIFELNISKESLKDWEQRQNRESA